MASRPALPRHMPQLVTDRAAHGGFVLQMVTCPEPLRADDACPSPPHPASPAPTHDPYCPHHGGAVAAPWSLAQIDSARRCGPCLHEFLRRR